MYTQRMRAAWVTVVIAAAAATGASGQAAAPQLRVTLGSSMSQGDVQRVVVEGAGAGAKVSALAFGLPVHLGLTAKGDWEGLVGVDLAQKPGKYQLVVTVTQLDGSPLTAQTTVAVAARRFPTRRLKVSPRFVEPGPEDAARIAADAKRLAEVFASLSSRQWQGAFRPPVSGPSTSNFGSRSVFNGQPRAPHAGVDYAGDVGTPIVAPNAGRVVLAEGLFLTGNTVVVDHGLGLYSLFAHLSQIDVKVGSDLGTGFPVGLVGKTGRVTGPHLHWSVRLGAARVDPTALLLLGP
jgi:murein DD-endopeptidase MepM/ murein hydrolase activator NlpD